MLRPLALASITLVVVGTHPAVAQTNETRTLASHPTLNYYGMPGLIDMPTADVMPDGTLGVTASYFANQTRGTLSFQLLPRVTGSFRYAGMDGFRPGPDNPRPGVFYYDRSFDIHWLAIEEESWWPAVAIGIRDLAGTGVYGGEYVVATRHFGAQDQLAMSLGIGWGRLGQRSGFTNPLGVLDSRFETRPTLDFGVGGTFSFDQFFRGDAAFFGGIEWQATDRLRFQVEYSSDLYLEEVADDVLTVESPLNFGATYQLSDSATLGASYLYGNTFGISLSLTLDPRRPSTNSFIDAAPQPVVVRPPQTAAYDTTWVSQPDAPVILRDNINRLFDENDLRLVSLALDSRRAVIRVQNTRFDAESMALGRAMRVLTATMPNSVDVFEVVFVVEGMDVSRVRMTRSDIEALEQDVDGAALALERAVIEDPLASDDPELIQILNPTQRLTWDIGPYIRSSLFDPSSPFRGELGVQASARYAFGGGFVAEGRLRAPLIGNLDEPRSIGFTALPPVRTDGYLYDRENDIYLDYGTVSHYGRPARNLYSRLTLGYLERMYAGVSGELLWQPVNSDIGVGLEVNHVWQRAFEDGGLGLQDYNITTGHASLYFDLGNRFEAQVDAGRYLAGDWGATFSLERVFDNGWRVGAFATFTDVSFEDFGEGSFDKGITLDVPLSWFTGNSGRTVQSATVRPVQRDGGARLSVNGRLHGLVTDYTRPELEDTQGLIWR
ncbi:YjbH domain-containing protein [Roseicyclus mahoneyensis]|uniref:Exopolysaccharide biosynthesis protein YbjH n=1 Tax=Roseicyclus mahoneyensis TaxID=164332 RepID=A0A316GHJ9_9RHOB|nr:YjbH domain-containing protein [Roseicyclus mahoneyensis]PWK60536.1 exopolysaccharide biosynthesis protein YbjH [Roseicyclus mahoneyensis]